MRYEIEDMRYECGDGDGGCSRDTRKTAIKNRCSLLTPGYFELKIRDYKSHHPITAGIFCTAF